MFRKYFAWVLIFSLLLSMTGGLSSVAAGEELVDSSIATEADKAALYEWINKPINPEAFTADRLEAYEVVKAQALQVAEDETATKEQVDAALAELIRALDQDIPGPDHRYELQGASWVQDTTQGSIELVAGQYAWKFAEGSKHWLGIGDPEGILADSQSVTYEYEIMMDTVNGNDRCFLAYGETWGWHSVEEGAFAENGETGGYFGNGFAAHGHWGDMPAIGEWGTIRIQNDRYDPTKTSDRVEGAITALGCWVDNGDLYVRSVKVYDTEDPSKVISLTFKQDGTGNLEPFPPYVYACYDWDVDDGYAMEIRFPENGGPQYEEVDGRRAVVIVDDFMYVNVDDTIISETQQYIRINIFHQNGCTLQVEYNAQVPDGVDTSVEPYLTYYNYRSSNGLHRIEDSQNVGHSSVEYENPLGVIRPTSPEHSGRMITSIYLTNAQFRDACNGSDFRLRVFGGAIINRIEVHPCGKDDIPAVGDATRLREVYEELAEEYKGDFGGNTALEAAFYEVEDFLTYHYRASQAEIDAMLNTLYTAVPRDILGDVDGDHEITSTDARLVLQYYAGKIPAEDLNHSLADVDGDGVITSTDARLILQLYAGKIEDFPL